MYSISDGRCSTGNLKWPKQTQSTSAKKLSLSKFPIPLPLKGKDKEMEGQTPFCLISLTSSELEPDLSNFQLKEKAARRHKKEKGPDIISKNGKSKLSPGPHKDCYFKCSAPKVLRSTLKCLSQYISIVSQEVLLRGKKEKKKNKPLTKSFSGNNQYKN